LDHSNCYFSAAVIVNFELAGKRYRRIGVWDKMRIRKSAKQLASFSGS
jgi:hypothetical protein